MTLVLGLVAHQRLTGLDARFFALSSIPGFQGFLAYLLGDYARAAKGYRQHLAETSDKGPDSPGTRALLMGAFDAARREALDSLANGRYERDARLTLAEVALASGQSHEAIAQLDAVLAKDTDQFDAQLLKAVVQTRLGLDGDAIVSLNRALRHSRVETRPTVFLSALAVMGELGSRPANRPGAWLIAQPPRF